MIISHSDSRCVCADHVGEAQFRIVAAGVRMLEATPRRGAHSSQGAFACGAEARKPDPRGRQVRRAGLYAPRLQVLITPSSGRAALMHYAAGAVTSDEMADDTFRTGVTTGTKTETAWPQTLASASLAAWNL